MAEHPFAQRIFQDLKELCKTPPEGIEVKVKRTDLRNYETTIFGPEGTPYYGYKFLVDWQIPDEFPRIPPKAIFRTPIWHPNIHTDGRICLDLIHRIPEKREGVWNQTVSLWQAANAVRTLLTNYNLEDPYNMKCANEWAADLEAGQKKSREFCEKFAVCVSQNSGVDVANHSQSFKLRLGRSNLFVMIRCPFLISLIEPVEMETHFVVKATGSSVSPYTFLHWEEQPIVTPSERLTIYLSLVHVVKMKCVFSSSLEDKAVSFLKEIKPDNEKDVNSFILDLVPSSLPESSCAFVESVVELISVPNKRIIIAALELVSNIVVYSAKPTLLILVSSGLIPKVVTSLNIFSLSFKEAEMIHHSLILIILAPVYYSKDMALGSLDSACPEIHQTFRETLHKSVILPTEGYIRHLCNNRYLIKDYFQSNFFVNLLLQLLAASLCHPSTMELALSLPICLTIPSALTFFEHDIPSLGLSVETSIKKRPWMRLNGEMQDPCGIVLRLLRSEGIDDVLEQRLNNDITEDKGREVVKSTINWNNLLGMNLNELE
ncbi:putative Ubiquitin-conjugating enzyme E2 29 [Blattamonas nauphoetae]|uniref:Ubiquitin-conjugating enzyme E2 29 n=1 Tax=Blattamonas nauphoetae TaxID=2049346 RepID=A0ABQ9XEC2_9EUKA|nr:putative Ubiquitin-conjugating enzyme E2 29 [Blattamonas nauphoetae]